MRGRALLVLLVTAVALAATSTAATAAAPPYMGVNTWYAFGTEIDQGTIVTDVDAVVARGLEAAGYRYVWIDAGWWDGTRDAAGQIVVNRAQWPRGMAWVARYIHSRGLRAGIYTDLGSNGCDSGGSYGHYQTDVNTFAAWGFDAVKVDNCGGSRVSLNPRTYYTAFARAIRRDRPHRTLLYSICNAETPGELGGGRPSYADSAFDSYAFAPKLASSWRTGPDIGHPGDVEFAQVLYNIRLDAAHPGAAGDGHYSDPDYLVADEGMTTPEFQAQLSMWAILAAPLVVGDDIATLPRADVELLLNRGLIAIDQDRLGIQGREVSHDGALSEWQKPLAGGAKAIAYLNASSLPATVTAPKGVVRNVWTGQKPAHRTLIAPDSVLLLRVS